MIHPCCGNSLQRGVKIMAIIDIIIELLNLGLYIGALVGVLDLKDDSDKNVGLTSLIIAIILSIMAIGLATRLYFGAKNRDLRNCKIWFIVTWITLAINLIVFIANSSAGDISEYDTSAIVLGTLYRLYMLWLVYAFMQELKKGDSGFQQQGVVYYIHPQSGIPNNNSPYNNGYNPNQPPIV